MTQARNDTAAQPPSPRFITTSEFLQKLRGSRSTLGRLEKSDPDFPKPGQLTPGGTRLWLESAVDGYLLAKLAAPAKPNTARVAKAVGKSARNRATAKTAHAST